MSIGIRTDLFWLFWITFLNMKKYFFNYGGRDAAFRPSKEAEVLQEGAKAQAEATWHDLVLFIGIGFAATELIPVYTAHSNPGESGDMNDEFCFVYF